MAVLGEWKVGLYGTLRKGAALTAADETLKTPQVPKRTSRPRFA